jgi:hypothetical protein
MGYLRCESCGAKALSAASQCPKCAEPFNLLGARGDRVALKKCSGCGIMHRRGSSCHWCGDLPVPAWRSSAVLKSGSGIAAVALLALGSWSVREPASEAFGRMYTEAVASGSRTDESVRRSPASVSKGQAPPSANGMQAGSNAESVPVAHGASGTPNGAVNDILISGEELSQDVADSIRWVPAVALTWVNVRSNASRGGDVVGVIKPDEKAMLGVGRAGWRQVRLSDMKGWVDPALFETDTLRTRGL